jgi:hypothetical protein
MKNLLCLLATCAVALSADRADACGAIVSPPSELVLQNQQRAFISLHEDGSSNVVLQLGIPSVSVPFGALTPVFGQPTLDSEPVDVSELDELDSRTRPTAGGDPDTGGGCGCGSAAGADDRAGGSNGGVNVVQIVDIGPVTAAVLGADSTGPLTQWLTDNGFEIPANDLSVIDQYVGADNYFVAFKRSSQAGVGPSSVGVSFSVAGDQRGYALRMSRLGASDRLAIQVFVAAPESVAPKGSGPTNPFEALTLADFSVFDLENDYTNAVFQKVAAANGKAFVVEGVYQPSAGWREPLGTRLFAITDANQNLTRLATVMAPGSLTEDVMFRSDPPDNVPTHVSFMPPRLPVPHQNPFLYGGLLGLVLVSWLTRRSFRSGVLAR